MLAALDGHPDEADIQTKGLVLLGVLIQARRAAQLGPHRPCRLPGCRVWSLLAPGPWPPPPLPLTPGPLPPPPPPPAG